MTTKPSPVRATLGTLSPARLVRSRGAVATTALLGLWGLVTVGSFMLDDQLSPRFLDLPLGAFLAGQGALMGLVMVGIRIVRTDLEGRGR